MRVLLALVLVALLASGCVRPDAAPTPENESPAMAPAAMVAPSATPQTGSLKVLARMPDMTLLAGVHVTVGNLTRGTGADGVARFDALPPGPVEITARKEAHRTAQLGAHIVAGEEAFVEAVLPAQTGDQHAHEKGVLAHRDLYRFAGHFDCSATYVIITGDCFLLVDNVTDQAGLPRGNVTTSRNLIDFPVDRNWTALVVEMRWNATATATEATGQGMTLAIEPSEAPADGHAAKYARVQGGSPLRVELESGVKHATATAEDKPNPEGGEVLRARAYVMGAGHKPAGTDFLGVGAAKDQAFELFVSIFYGEPVPEGYTAL